MMKEFLWESSILDPTSSAGSRGSHLYTVPVQVNDTWSIQEPDSQFLHELVPSPLDLKATLGVGVVPVTFGLPTQSRSDHGGWKCVKGQ